MQPALDGAYKTCGPHGGPSCGAVGKSSLQSAFRKVLRYYRVSVVFYTRHRLRGLHARRLTVADFPNMHASIKRAKDPRINFIERTARESSTLTFLSRLSSLSSPRVSAIAARRARPPHYRRESILLTPPRPPSVSSTCCLVHAACGRAQRRRRCARTLTYEREIVDTESAIREAQGSDVGSSAGCIPCHASRR